MHDPYDRSSKWLIDHHGGALLKLAGVRSVRRWRAVQAEVVQPKQLPDGLLEVHCRGRRQADPWVVEIATYPEARATEQALADALLVLLDRGQLPDVLTLVLRPRGQLCVTGSCQLDSPQGSTQLQFRWRVVELWTRAAAELLALQDVGLIPWVPLTQFDGPPEPLLQQCRQRIDHQAPAAQHANFLAVSQVLTKLRYNDPALLEIFGGSRAMIESPLIQELMTKNTQQTRREVILEILKDRFGAVPAELAAQVQTVVDEGHLLRLVRLAYRCADRAAFQAELAPSPPPDRPRRKKRT